MVKKLSFIIVLICNFIFCAFEFSTIWGQCILKNDEKSIKNIELQNIIINKIEKLDKLYGPIKKKQFTIIIYPLKNQDVQINSHHWNWSLGITYYNDKIIIKDISYAHINKSKFRMVLDHELNHLMVNRITKAKNVPRWFKEGFAMYVANEQSMRHKFLVSQAILKDNLFLLKELNKFKNLNKNEFNLAYAQSVVYIENLVHIYGSNTLKRIIEELKNQVDFNRAVQSVTSHDIYQIEAKLIQNIKNKYFLLRFVNFPDILFSIMPLLLIIGFIIKSHKVKKIKKQWELEEELEDLMQ